MKKWKVLFFTTLFVLFTSNLFWLYVVIEQGVSYTYLNQSYQDTNHTIDHLSKLIVKGSAQYSQSDILHLLRQTEPNMLISESDNTITTEFATFTFNNNQLIAIKQSQF